MKEEWRKCNGGPKGPWCGKTATVVCTERGTQLPLQWYACDDALHHDGATTTPIAEWFAKIGIEA